MVSGAAMVVQRLAHGMAGRGHEVLVISASDKRRPYQEKSGGVTEYRVQSLPNPLRVNQNFTLWKQKEVREALAAFRPEVVHTHDTLSMGLAGLFSAKDLGVPAVATIHQLPWFVSSHLARFPRISELTESGLWNYSTWLLAQFEAVIVPSKIIARILRRKAKCRPFVIGNGVDLDLFTPQAGAPDEKQRTCREFGLDPDQPVLLYVGRIDPDKQVDLLVTVSAIVFRSMDAQLLVIGDGRDRMQVMDQCSRAGIMDRCRFPGYISNREQLAAVYRASSVFLTASEVEIQSSVVLEAGSSGLPVVAFDASSMPEFIKDGETGFLVPRRQVRNMAEKTLSLLADPEMARAMGRAGRIFTERHSLAQAYRSHEQVYRAVSRGNTKRADGLRPAPAGR